MSITFTINNSLTFRVGSGLEQRQLLSNVQHQRIPTQISTGNTLLCFLLKTILAEAVLLIRIGFNKDPDPDF
jgi:hypothetical protein